MEMPSTRLLVNPSLEHGIPRVKDAPGPSQRVPMTRSKRTEKLMIDPHVRGAWCVRELVA